MEDVALSSPCAFNCGLDPGAVPPCDHEVAGAAWNPPWEGAWDVVTEAVPLGSWKGLLEPGVRPRQRARLSPGYRLSPPGGQDGQQRSVDDLWPAPALGVFFVNSLIGTQSWGHLRPVCGHVPTTPAGRGAVIGLVSAKLQTDCFQRELADPMPL